MRRLFNSIVRFASNTRCSICGGWGGEYGLNNGYGIRMCKDCASKGGKL